MRTSTQFVRAGAMSAFWLIFAAASALGCRAEIPDARFTCASGERCPPGFACVAGRCQRDAPDGSSVDGGPSLDGGPEDAEVVPTDSGCGAEGAGCCPGDTCRPGLECEAGMCVEETCEDPSTFYRDEDGDGFGDPDDSVESCARPSGYVEDDTDCDDTDALVNPEASERCNDIDDDCDGRVDEGLSEPIGSPIRIEADPEDEDYVALAEFTLFEDGYAGVFGHNLGIEVVLVSREGLVTDRHFTTYQPDRIVSVDGGRLLGVSRLFGPITLATIDPRSGAAGPSLELPLSTGAVDVQLLSLGDRALVVWANEFRVTRGRLVRIVGDSLELLGGGENTNLILGDVFEGGRSIFLTREPGSPDRALMFVLQGESGPMPLKTLVVQRLFLDTLGAEGVVTTVAQGIGLEAGVAPVHPEDAVVRVAAVSSDGAELIELGRAALGVAIEVDSRHPVAPVDSPADAVLREQALVGWAGGDVDVFIGVDGTLTPGGGITVGLLWSLRASDGSERSRSILGRINNYVHPPGVVRAAASSGLLTYIGQPPGSTESGLFLQRIGCDAE